MISDSDKALIADLKLGVHEDEVEYQVLQEPKSGLFGRLGGNPAKSDVLIDGARGDKNTLRP